MPSSDDMAAPRALRTAADEGTGAPNGGDSDLARALEALRALATDEGRRAWVVGGTVRDLLLGLPARDLDVAVTGDSLALARMLADSQGWSFVALDRERGTGRVVTEHGYEIDINALAGGSIEEDLGRRDITVNALAVPLEVMPTTEAAPPLDAALVLDPFGGVDDLDYQLVRLVSATAIVDDPLRALRVFRFSTQLGFIIEPDTLAAVREHAPLLAQVATERVTVELAEILRDTCSAAVLRRMDEVGLLGVALPELEPGRGITQNEYHHLDVLDHSLLALDRLERLLGDLESVFGSHADEVAGYLSRTLAAQRPRLFSVKLATLLHDAGKPPTRSTDHGHVTFYQHNVEGADIGRDLARRLRLSSAETEEIAYYVHGHMVPGDVEKTAFEADAGAARRAVTRYATRRGEAGLVLALMAVADSMAMSGPLADPERPQRLREFACRAAAAFYGDVRPRIDHPALLDGAELMRRFGLEEGPQVGRVLARLRELQLEGRIVTREDALAEAARLLAAPGNASAG